MKKSVFIVVAILMLLIVPSVFAVEVKVKTLPGHIVTVFLRTPGAFDVLDFHQGKAEGGIVNFESGFYQDQVDLQVNVGTSGGDNIIVFKKAGVDASGIIDLYLPNEDGALVNTRPLEGEEEVEEVVEEEEAEDVVEENAGTSAGSEEAEDTEEEVEEVVEEEEAEDVVDGAEEGAVAGITGNAVEGVKDLVTSKKSYYILGAIVGLFVLVFVIQTGRKKIGGSGNYKVVKYEGGGDDKRILDAERKLAEAKKELDDIKNRKKKLAEAKARFQKDREELSRLE